MPRVLCAAHYHLATQRQRPLWAAVVGVLETGGRRAVRHLADVDVGLVVEDEVGGALAEPAHGIGLDAGVDRGARCGGPLRRGGLGRWRLFGGRLLLGWLLRGGRWARRRTR